MRGRRARRALAFYRTAPTHRHRRSPVDGARPAAVRGGEPVPRHLQLPADPAARRRGADRAGAAASSGCRAGTSSGPTGSSCCSCSCSGRTSSTRLFDPFLDHLVPLRPDDERGRAISRSGSSGRCAPRPLDAADARVGRGSCSRPDELAVWEHARAAPIGRESVAVARRTRRARSGPTPTQVWLAAALLHDVGKAETGLGPVRPGRRDGRRRGRRATAGPGTWPSRIGRYVDHDDLGAERLRAAGARPEAVAWAGAHHRPERWAATGIPPGICRDRWPRPTENQTGRSELRHVRRRYTESCGRPPTPTSCDSTSRSAPRRARRSSGPQVAARPVDEGLGPSRLSARRRKRVEAVRSSSSFLALAARRRWVGVGVSSSRAASRAPINGWIDDVRGDVARR